MGSESCAVATSARRTSIVGEWRLKEYVVTIDDAEVPWCDGANGMLIYTASGYMSVAINCAGAVADDAPSRVFDNRLMYAGTYSFQSDHEVVHHIHNCSQLEQIGDDVIRTFVLDDQRLVLTGKPFKGRRAFRIVWERLSPAS